MPSSVSSRHLNNRGSAVDIVAPRAIRAQAPVSCLDQFDAGFEVGDVWYGEGDELRTISRGVTSMLQEVSETSARSGATVFAANDAEAVTTEDGNGVLVTATEANEGAIFVIIHGASVLKTTLV